MSTTGAIGGIFDSPQPRVDTAALTEAAKGLEAAFLSEMLKASGFGETPSAFGGGIGEEQFASFLRDSVAAQMVEGGGIGLAERLFESLAKAKNHGG